MNIEGIDVSYYQGKIDWPKVAAAGKKFAIIRSGDGTFLDPMYERNLEGATAAGLKRLGVYHYLRFGVNPLDHISLCLRQLEVAKRINPNVWFWPDWEDANAAFLALTVMQRNHWASAFLCELEDALTERWGTYTAKWWLDAYGVELGDFVGYAPLWVAQYPFYDGACQSDPTKAGLQPALPQGWNDWAIWQYSSMGTCPGIEGYVDLDVAKPGVFKEGDMAITLVRRAGDDKVYFLAGGKLIWIPSQAIFHAAEYDENQIKVLPVDSPIWGLPVEGPHRPD